MDQRLAARRQSVRLKGKTEKGQRTPSYAELDTDSILEGEKLIFKTTDPTSDDVEVAGTELPGRSSRTGDHLYRLGIDFPNERIDLAADVIHTDEFPMSLEVQKRIITFFCCLTR
jgi:hypothetical protein